MSAIHSLWLSFVFANYLCFCEGLPILLAWEECDAINDAYQLAAYGGSHAARSYFLTQYGPKLSVGEFRKRCPIMSSSHRCTASTLQYHLPGSEIKTCAQRRIKLPAWNHCLTSGIAASKSRASVVPCRRRLPANAPPVPGWSRKQRHMLLKARVERSNEEWFEQCWP